MPQKLHPAFCYELEIIRILEQANAQVMGKIDVLTVAGNPAIGDTHDQFALNHPF